MSMYSKKNFIDSFSDVYNENLYEDSEGNFTPLPGNNFILLTEDGGELSTESELILTTE